MLNLKYNDEVYNIDDPDEAVELIDNVLSDLNDDILANLWNDWADKKGYSEEHIFCMSELEDYLMIRLLMTLLLAMLLTLIALVIEKTTSLILCMA